MKAVISNQRVGLLYPQAYFWIWLAILILVGFALRLLFSLALIFHVDEYLSMLAALMVAQKGAPIFPSGFFYDHGLLVSYLSGALTWLFGFNERIARWPLLIASTLTIPVNFIIGRRLFRSQPAGLFAVIFITFNLESIEWGGRARMYSLAYLFLLLVIFFAFLSLRRGEQPRFRYLFLGALLGALLSHTIIFAILPPLLLSAAILWVINGGLLRRKIWRERIPWLEIVAGTLILGIPLVLFFATRQRINVNEFPDDAGASSGLLGTIAYYVHPAFSWSRLKKLIEYFVSVSGWLPVILSLAAWGWAALHFIRRRAGQRDAAAIFLGLVIGLTVLEMAAFLPSSWGRTRYLYILSLPLFILLVADGVARLLEAVILVLKNRTLWKNNLILSAACIAALAFFLPGAIDVADARSSGDYNTAFAYVRENWQSGDRIMTVHPAAAYLYLRRCDYYANQNTAKLLDEASEEDLPMDRYTASPLIDSVEALNKVLAGSHRLWFVVDKYRLYGRYEPYFTQQIFAQMDYVKQEGTIFVFLSHSYPTPLPANPEAKTSGDFDHWIRLDGYYVDEARIAPDGTFSAGLYWKPVGNLPASMPKVFAHLRNGKGQTIAQADHFIFEKLLNSEEWAELRKENEWLRDNADFRLPLPLPAGNGPYSILVGLYDPDSFERVPLLNDTSGENAVIIPLEFP